jgi:hypothetical protein
MEPLEQLSRRVMARADAAFPLPKPGYLDGVIWSFIVAAKFVEPDLTNNESHIIERTLYLEVEPLW